MMCGVNYLSNVCWNRIACIPTASQYSTTLYGNFYFATLVSDTAARYIGCHLHSVSLSICHTRFAKRRGSLGVTLVGLFSGGSLYVTTLAELVVV